MATFPNSRNMTEPEDQHRTVDELGSIDNKALAILSAVISTYDGATKYGKFTLPQPSIYHALLSVVDLIASSSTIHCILPRVKEPPIDALTKQILRDLKSSLLAISKQADDGPPPENAPIKAILTHYWETHSDGTPGAFQARRAGALLIEWLVDVRKQPEPSAADFSTPWQHEFIKWLGHEKNHAVATIAREMCIIAAAFNHAVKSIVINDQGTIREVQFLQHTVPILYTAEKISRLTSKPEPTPRDWLPTWVQMAQFIDTIGYRTSKGEWSKNSENLFRYVAVALNTWARPEAILDLYLPTQVDFESGIVRLNPPSRKQTKKVRPMILLTDNLRAMLKDWNCDRPVHRNGVALKSIKKVFKTHATDLGMPKFTPYTLRHFMATNIRRMEGCNVTREQRQEWLGHKPQDTTGWYEHFDPEWLREAKIGTDKIIARLNSLLKTRTLLPITPPTANGEPDFKRVVSK